MASTNMSFRLHNIAYMDNIYTITSTNVNTDVLTTRIVDAEEITTTLVTADDIVVNSISAKVPANGVMIEDVRVKMGTIFSNELSLKCPSNDNTITVSAPSGMPASYNIKLPIDMGVSGYVLATDGIDQVYWTVGGGGGGGTTFKDSEFQIINHLSLTKHISFDVTAITANRVITMPDNNVTLPDQSVSTTSSPTFVSVITDTIREKTAGLGVSLLKTDSKKILSAKPDAIYFYDDNEVCYKSIHGMIGTVPAGVGNYTICNINFTSPSVAYLDIYSTIKDGTLVDILSTQDVINYTGTPPLTLINVLDISKHIGLTYSVSGSSVIIECARDLVISKTYNTNITIRPTSGTYTVTFY